MLILAVVLISLSLSIILYFVSEHIVKNDYEKKRKKEEDLFNEQDIYK
jgi:hypothetical protein